jgi:hypothetical protein
MYVCFLSTCNLFTFSMDAKFCRLSNEAMLDNLVTLPNPKQCKVCPG